MTTEVELKAGHLPAEIVGGRRVVNKKERRISETDRVEAPTAAEVEVREILDTDLPAKMERSYPTESVKKMHDPRPVKDFPKHQPEIRNHHNFQPRKSTH
ncbi:unnamed protein product [Caenorhabditis bovis]|uniref:Uncharacterized protein n=1 Tax=Caenorhabditis bovis TaxID=2654633 RepID=A0A8S1F1L9_9PELO|nr:unnamed protein product [Caenorhabditis bovis]